MNDLSVEQAAPPRSLEATAVCSAASAALAASEAPGGLQLQDAFAELRGLLFSEEQLQLARLRRRIEDAQLRTEDVGRVLAQAIALQTAEGSALTAALTPNVEAAIASSILRDPQVLANSIFPIMGAAIRKSIAAALQSMTQSPQRAPHPSHGVLR